MELKAEVWSRVHGETLLPIAGSATCLIQPRYTCLDMIAYTVGLGKCPTGIPQSDRGNSSVKCPSFEVCLIDNQNYLKCNFLSVIWFFENWPWGSAISGSGVMNYPAAVQLQIVLRLQWVFLQLGGAPLMCVFQRCTLREHFQISRAHVGIPLWAFQHSHLLELQKSWTVFVWVLFLCAEPRNWVMAGKWGKLLSLFENVSLIYSRRCFSCLKMRR